MSKEMLIKWERQIGEKIDSIIDGKAILPPVSKVELRKGYYLNKKAINALRGQGVIPTPRKLDIFKTFTPCEKAEIKEYNPDEIIDFIVDLSIHERYAISIVKSMASNPKHYCMVSCQNIVNTGYTDIILEDIKQEIFLALFEMVEKKQVWLENNALVFATYINSKGKETSYFMYLYKVVEKALYGAKKDEQRFSPIKFNPDKHSNYKYVTNGFISDKFGNPYLKGIKVEYIDSYNNDVTSVNSSNYKSTLFAITDNNLQDIVYRKDVKRFFLTVKELYPKYYSDFCIVFEGLYKGYSYKEIAEHSELTERRIKYIIPLMRDKFNEIMTNGISIDKEKTVSLYSDTTRNKGTTTYINRCQIPMFTNGITITIGTKKQKEYPRIANYEYDIPEWERIAMRKEKEENEKAIYDGAIELYHVIDARKAQIVTIDSEGHEIRRTTLKCYGSSISKFAKFHHLEYL